MSDIYNIDTCILVDAINYYTSIGYQPISVPMLVDSSINALTTPTGVVCKEHLGLEYVGSAEQSFLQMIKDGKISKGKYFAITPCQRSDTPDESHLEIFLKLELICIGEDCVKSVLQEALQFFNSYGEFNSIKTNIGFDIESSNSVEVGSYGVREVFGTTYTYGTGVALPRISYALK